MPAITPIPVMDVELRYSSEFTATEAGRRLIRAGIANAVDKARAAPYGEKKVKGERLKVKGGTA
jgi:hypothetical protein